VGKKRGWERKREDGKGGREEKEGKGKGIDS